MIPLLHNFLPLLRCGLCLTCLFPLSLFRRCLLTNFLSIGAREGPRRVGEGHSIGDHLRARKVHPPHLHSCFHLCVCVLLVWRRWRWRAKRAKLDQWRITCSKCWTRVCSLGLCF